MAKLTHTNIVNITGAETAALAAINANGTLTEAAIENTLSRDGTSPNTMGADLDMNSKDINNVINVNATKIYRQGVELTPSTVEASVPQAAYSTAIVASITALKAIDTTVSTVAINKETNREGVFVWTVGDFSTEVTADPQGGTHVKANAIATTAGAWIRVNDGIVNVTWFGATGDGIRLVDGAVTSGTPDFTSASASFVSGDVGKTLIVEGAGAAGVVLVTTIQAFVSGTAVTLAINASTTITGNKYSYGTDDSTALQAAIDTGTLGIFFPDGIYMSNTELTCSTAGQNFYGSSANMQSDLAPRASIQFGQNGNCFLVTASGCHFSGLHIFGTRLGSDVAIKSAKTSNTDDMDLSVTDCFIEEVTKGILQVGRGLLCNDNLFSQLNGAGAACISISWPTSGVVATGLSALPEGFRAWRIQNNRAHASSILVQTTGVDRDDFHGAIISGNLMDTGDRLFEGGIRSSIISNNVSEFANKAIIYIDLGGGDMTICGNVLAGHDGDATESPSAAIHFDTNSVPDRVTIANNLIQFIDLHGIRFVPAANRISIIGNIIDEVNQDASTGTCIKIETSLTNSVITGNVFKPENSTNIIGAGSATLTRVSIIGNSALTTDALVSGSPTDGGGNITMHNGKLSLGSHVDVGSTNSLNITQSGSLIGTWERTGSSAAIGMVYKNTAGSIQIFGLPTGSNDGSFIPGTDGAIDLGSASNKWEEVFSDNATINTSDERKKRDITPISDRVLDAWADVEFSIYRLKASVEKKGDDARWHCGLIAQRIEAVFRSHGLDPFAYGVLCFDAWEAEEGLRTAGDLYSIRYSQAYALEAALMRREIKELRYDSK